MKILILGAGVIGVTQAWELARDGHEVTVIDRQPGPALETSFANAGEVSPGYSAPWAAPGIPLKALKWMFMRHAPLVIQPTLDPVRLSWMARMLANCTTAAYGVNKARMVRLADYSRARLQSIRETTAIAYDERTQGTLQLFRTQAQVDAAAKDIKVLKAGGVAFEVLDRAGCLAAEPGLAAAADRIAGGLRLPGDETGDCHLFTTRLTALAQGAGVRFVWNTAIRHLTGDRTRVTGAETDAGTFAADAVIVALGAHSPRLTAPFGIRLPVHPVKGYSLTFDIRNEAAAPVSTVMDETHKIAITRLGSRIRVGGMAELAGFSTALPEARRATLRHSVDDLFGAAGDSATASFWCGHRPMTPDGTPVVGRTGVPGLWTNTGHGTLGWTMAAGSARLVADLIAGRQPDIDHADLGHARYLRGSRADGGFIPQPA